MKYKKLESGFMHNIYEIFREYINEDTSYHVNYYKKIEPNLGK